VASKTTKRARGAAGSRAKEPEDKRRFVVRDIEGRQVYPGNGVILSEAESLSRGLVIDNRIHRVADSE